MPFPGGTQGAHDDGSHQGSAKRDAANGLAGLDASAKVPNSSLYYGVANGIAELDANVLLSPSEMYPFVEEYANHLGATDNFTQTGTGGGGTAAADATNHEMDLSTGTTASAYAHFSAKRGWALGPKPTVLNVRALNFVTGAGSVRRTNIGLSGDWTAASPSNECTFQQVSDGSWRASSTSVGVQQVTSISAIADGDHLTIVVTTSKIKYYVNGALVATHTTRIPSGIIYMGGGVYTPSAAATTAREASLDFMSIKRYI